MSKATHFGTCQICGSQQKLPRGNLAKHGYTVQWGFFSGVCTGSDYLPFEVSTDRIAIAVENVTGQRARLIEHAAEVRAMTGAAAFVKVDIRDAQKKRIGSKWEQVEVTMKAYDHDASTSRPVFVVEGKTVSASDVVGYGVESNSVESAAAAMREKRAAALDFEAGRMQEYINWQTARIRNWTPGTLVPVVTNDKPRVAVGAVVKVFGDEMEVLAIGDKVASGSGPHLNGRLVPHATLRRADGSTFAFPVIRIRTIVKAA